MNCDFFVHRSICKNRRAIRLLENAIIFKGTRVVDSTPFWDRFVNPYADMTGEWRGGLSLCKRIYWSLLSLFVVMLLNDNSDRLQGRQWLRYISYLPLGPRKSCPCPIMSAFDKQRGHRIVVKAAVFHFYCELWLVVPYVRPAERKRLVVFSR